MQQLAHPHQKQARHDQPWKGHDRGGAVGIGLRVHRGEPQAVQAVKPRHGDRIEPRLRATFGGQAQRTFGQAAREDTGGKPGHHNQIKRQIRRRLQRGVAHLSDHFGQRQRPKAAQDADQWKDVKNKTQELIR